MEQESGETEGGERCSGLHGPRSQASPTAKGEGGQKRRRLPPERWRAAQGDPGHGGSCGNAATLAPVPTPAPAQTLDSGSSLSPRPSFLSPTLSPASSLHPPGAPKIPGSPRSLPAPGPSWPNSLFPECSRPPPTARPSRSSQNPRARGLCPAPTPTPGGRGAGEAHARVRAPASRAPLFPPAAVPGPPGHPPGNPGVPHSRLWGLERPEAAGSSPRGLNP